MKFLMLAVLLAVMQAAPSTTTAKDQRNADQGKALPAPSSPVPSNVRVVEIPAVKVTPSKRDLVDYSYLVFNGLLVVVGALQVFLLFGTLKTVRQQTVIMERQINKERVRIRVTLKPFGFEKQEEDEIVQTVYYTVTFYGFTYGFIDEDTFEVMIADSADAGDGQPTMSIPTNESPKVIAPGTPPEERLEPLSMTQFEADSVLHGKSFIHFRGRIKYRDFTDIPRETTVCCVWKPFGPIRKKFPPPILAGKGTWKKAGPPEANHET